MVSARTTKTQKVSYNDRVLGAFSHIQREHKKHAIHPAALRAQIKRDAQEKKDKLGPNWSHWVSRALTKLGEEGILEHASPNGSVALTSKGKKAIDFARRSSRHAIEASPGRNEDGILWKHVISYSASKRPRKSITNMVDDVSEDSDAYRTPSKSNPPKKRVRLSLKSSGKKPISKMTKAELRIELNALQRKDVLRTFEKELSPLTDLESDSEEERHVRGYNQELSNVRRQLFPAKKKPSAPGTSEGETCHFATLGNQVTTFESPTPLTVNSGVLVSRNRLGGITRTESGSYIPDISRQPTPAPSSPDMDMEYDDSVFTSGGNFVPAPETLSHGDSTLLINAVQTNATGTGEMHLFRARVAQESDARNLQHSLELEQRDVHITSLTAEISSLQKRIAEDASLVKTKVAQMASLEDAISGRVKALESLVAERNGTIDALDKQNNTFKAELAVLQESWRRAEETVTTTSQRLTTSEARIVELQIQRESEKRDKGILVNLLDEARRNHGSIQAELEQLRREFSELEATSVALRTEKAAATSETAVLKHEIDQVKASIVERTEALNQASVNTQTMREKNEELECVIVNYQEQLVEKQRYSEQLESKLQHASQTHTQLSDEVAELKASMEEKSSQLGQGHARIVALENSLSQALEEQEALQISLSKATENLKFEDATRIRLEQELTNMRRELEIAHADRAQSALQNESLAADVAAKQDSIDRLSEEKVKMEGQLTVSEKCINGLQHKLDESRMEHARVASELETALASTTADYAAAKEELTSVVRDKRQMELDMSAVKSQVSNLDSRLNAQSAEKAEVQTALLLANARAQEMEERLQMLQEENRNNKQSLSALREGLKHLCDL